MRPLARAAAVTALVSAVAAFVPDPPPKQAPPSAAPTASALRPVCGLRAIPEGDTCVPLPGKNQPLGPAEAARTPPSAKEDLRAAFLPRRPDRPADYAAYVLPIDAPAPAVLSEGVRSDPAPGERTGVDFAIAKGAKVVLALLEGQADDAKVVFVGEDAGVTVATLCSVREGDAVRSYLVIYGHLDRPGPGVVAGSRVHMGDPIGFTGDSGSKGVEELYLEARVVREGALKRLIPDDTAVPKARLADDALSVATDIRNVLVKKQ